MTRRHAYLTLAVVCLFSGTSALAQQKLGDLVGEMGFDWMVGKWVAMTDDGQEIQLVYKWELDKHVVSVYLKMGIYESRSLIYYVPAKEEVVQIGADNQGGHSKGLWAPSGEKAVSKIDGTDANGQVNKMGVVYSKVDADTMKVEIYEIDSAGELADYAWATVQFKRKN